MYENNIDQRYKVPMQAQSISQLPGQNLANPVMQGEIVNAEKLKQTANDSYIGGRASEMAEEDTTKQALIAIPAWYAICQSMDAFAKKCRGIDKDGNLTGKFEHTVQHKMGKWGDDVTNFVKKSKFGKSGFATSINNGFKSFNTWFDKTIVENSAVLRAFKRTPSQPRNKMVKGPANGMKGYLLLDYDGPAQSFFEARKHVNDLDCYGADSKLIKKARTAMQNATDKRATMQKFEFEALLRPNDGERVQKLVSKFDLLDANKKAEVLKNLKAKRFGYKNYADFENIMKDVQKNADDIIIACKKADKKVFMRRNGSNSGPLGKLQKHLIGRDVYPSEFGNKLLGSLGNEKLSPKLTKYLKDSGIKGTLPTTKLGKGLPKFMNILLEGATNRTAGGKLVAALQAFYLAEVILKSVKAEKGDKAKTFIERFVEMVALFAFIPYSVKLLHQFGGIQYAGMTEKSAVNAYKNLLKSKKLSKDELKSAKEVLREFNNAVKGGKKPVEAYREVLNNFNEKALNANLAKAQHKGGKKALKGILNGGTKNPIARLLKKCARTITGGLETIRSYRSRPLSPKLQRIFFKNNVGGLMRIGLVFAVIMPFFTKLVVKGTHMIFGRPKKSLLDKEEEVKPEENAQQQNIASNPQAAAVVHASPTNLLNKYANPQAQTMNLLPQQTQQTPYQQTAYPQQVAQQQTPYVPSQTNLLNKEQLSNKIADINNIEVKKPDEKPAEPIRTYIPSPVGVKVNPKVENTDPATAVLKRADAVEKMVLDTISMR